MTTEVMTKGGAELVVRPANFKDFMVLKNAISGELAKGGIDLKKDIDNISDLLGIIFKIDSSETIQNALWPCLGKCTYNKARITETLFDDNLEARGDYYEIALKCLEVNFRLFFKNHVSEFVKFKEKMTKSLEQK